MSDWISVKDELPDEDSLVVGAHIYNGDLLPDAAVFHFIYGRFCLHTDGLDASNYDGGASIYCEFKVTHWAKLPKLPITD